MGGFTSKPFPNSEGLQKLDSRENLSVWKTALCTGSNGAPCEGLANGYTMILPLIQDLNSSNIMSPVVKLRFFFREFEKRVEIDHDNCNNSCYVTTGLSLWMTVESDHSHDHSFVFSVKANKTVNDKQDSTPFHRDVLITGYHSKEMLLDEHFLTLSVQRKSPLEDGKEENKVTLPCGQENVWIHLKIDFAIKILFASYNMLQNKEGEYEEFLVGTRTGTTLKSQGNTYLIKDLKKLYSGEVLTDVVLKSADGITIKAHKVILAARSPYFSRIIQWNPSVFSKSTVPVPIDNVNAKSLFNIVHWMYTGELLDEIDVENVLQEIIKAAMKFEMSDLLKILEKRKHSSGGHGDMKKGPASQLKVQPCKNAARKIKRAIMAWFPLLRYRFGQRPVGLVASVINAIFGIYELI